MRGVADNLTQLWDEVEAWAVGLCPFIVKAPRDYGDESDRLEINKTEGHGRLRLCYGSKPIVESALIKRMEAVNDLDRFRNCLITSASTYRDRLESAIRVLEKFVESTGIQKRRTNDDVKRSTTCVSGTRNQ